MGVFDFLADALDSQNEKFCKEVARRTDRADIYVDAMESMQRAQERRNKRHSNHDDDDDF